MNHASENELLLLAYGELDEERATQVESHIVVCDECRANLARLERARVALDVAVPRVAEPRRARDWTAIVLAAAAVLAALLVTRPRPAGDAAVHWTPARTWSATAGYVAGGKAMADIDAQLTRLEQERYHGLPN